MCGSANRGCVFEPCVCESRVCVGAVAVACRLYAMFDLKTRTKERQVPITVK